MKENVIQVKSYAFAIRIVKLYRHFLNNKIEFLLIRQLVRSGVSIGANVEEAIGAQSRRDFLAKLSIAYKEARETRYWLRLMRDTEFLSLREAESLLDDLEVIIRIITRIQITVKSGPQRNS
jgi:four helix bundle protein